MSQDQTQEIVETSTAADELAVLKQRATLMGIPFSNNIGLETLRAKIKAVQEAPAEATPASTDVPPAMESGEKKSLIEVRREAMKLVRLRITCMNPAKKELYGEIFTFSNGVVGTVKKFVPFGEATDNGYHVPHCIYKMLKNRKYQHKQIIRDPVTKRERVKTSLAREFSIEVLPQLTKQELAVLAAQQANAAVHD